MVVFLVCPWFVESFFLNGCIFVFWLLSRGRFWLESFFKNTTIHKKKLSNQNRPSSAIKTQKYNHSKSVLIVKSKHWQIKNTTIHKKSVLIVKSKHGQTKNTTINKKIFLIVKSRHGQTKNTTIHKKSVLIVKSKHGHKPKIQPFTKKSFLINPQQSKHKNTTIQKAF